MHPPTAPFPNPSETVLRGFLSTNQFLVGISGGRDSVALLDWLIRAGYRNLVVCHLNHELRGRSSEADARSVKQMVRRYQQQIARQTDRLPESENGKRSPLTAARIDLAIDSADVRSLARKQKMSIETAARHARYEFFAKVARKKNCDAVLLAHHADDLVETFLINLFRGAGSTGLGSIRPWSVHRVAGVVLQVIRPLLGVWRDEINQYIRKHRLAFREDASNETLGPLRNRIRHRVIPYLEKNVGREIRQNIWRTATILSEEERFFSELVPEFENDSAEIALKPLRNMSVALQRRTLRKWLQGADVSDVGFELIERVRGLLDVAGGASRTNLPRDRHVRRRAGKLFLE